jgi:hypothetical protein
MSHFNQVAMHPQKIRNASVGAWAVSPVTRSTTRVVIPPSGILAISAKGALIARTIVQRKKPDKLSFMCVSNATDTGCTSSLYYTIYY